MQHQQEMFDFMKRRKPSHTMSLTVENESLLAKEAVGCVTMRTLADTHTRQRVR